MSLLVADVWAYLVLAVLLVVAAAMDVRTGKIRNIVTYPAIAVGLVGHTLIGGLYGDPSLKTMGLVGSLTGLAVGFGPLLLAWLAGGIGGGDAKLMAAVGVLSGWDFTLKCLFYGLVVAGVMAVFVMLQRRIFRRTLARLWRFFWLAFTPGKPADPATPDSPKIAFGLALCIGSGIALADHLIQTF